jgi:hypothetical protein
MSHLNHEANPEHGEYRRNTSGDLSTSKWCVYRILCCKAYFAKQKLVGYKPDYREYDAHSGGPVAECR